jgi:uncharacterized SAM-binding protein YcdF (DUF218 family)
LTFPFARRARTIILLAGMLLAGGGFFYLGHMITSTDPVEPADAVFVLGGSWLSRSLEAVRLYQEGKARHILISRGGDEYEAEWLVRRGIRIPSEADIQYDVIVNQLHIPAAAVVVLPQLVDNTAQEAEAAQVKVAAERWKKLIVLTDRASSRRAGFAFRRVLGNQVQVIISCNRNDPYNPSRWWATRWSLRTTFYEVPKLLAYWAGLRG